MSAVQVFTASDRLLWITADASVNRRHYRGGAAVPLIRFEQLRRRQKCAVFALRMDEAARHQINVPAEVFKAEGPAASPPRQQQTTGFLLKSMRFFSSFWFLWSV